MSCKYTCLILSAPFILLIIILPEVLLLTYKVAIRTDYIIKFYTIDHHSHTISPHYDLTTSFYTMKTVNTRVKLGDLYTSPAHIPMHFKAITIDHVSITPYSSRDGLGKGEDT